VLDINSTHYGNIEESKSCCCKKELGDRFFKVCDVYCCEDGPSTDEDFTIPVDMLDRMVCSYFEREDVPVPEDLATVYDNLNESENQYAYLPEQFDIHQFLTSMLNESPSTPKQQRMNEIINGLISNQNILPFIKLIWYHCFLIFCDRIPDDPEEVVIEFSRQAFTGITAELHSFWGSDQYLQYLKGLFNSLHLSDCYTVVGSEIGMKVYLLFLENLRTETRNRQIEEPVQFKVSEMLDEGQSKVRHVGAWAIRKVLEKGRKYVRQIFHSKAV